VCLVVAILVLVSVTAATTYDRISIVVSVAAASQYLGILHDMTQDYVRKHQDDVLYTEDDLNNCLAKCEVIDTHSAQEHRGIRFKAYAAGHVLGACMFMIEVR